MVEDVYEPLARYRDEFRARHAALTRAKFSELVRLSGVDVRANRRLSAEARRLARLAGSARTRLLLLGLLGAFGLGSAAIGAGLLFLGIPQDSPGVRALVFLGAVGAVAVGIAALVGFFRQRGRLHDIEARERSTQRRAERLLEPLFRQFAWEIPVQLVEQTVPRLAFDPYFTAKRLDDLRRLCGWSDAFNEGKSVLGCQSGVINGNPFVFADCLLVHWDSRTYYGSLEISWLEEEEDDEGRTSLVRRYETLRASVTKPYPEFVHDKLLVYGNDAAPNLSFSRRPTGLAGRKTGLWTAWKRRRARKRLEAFSRNLADDSNYTIMSNREFETLFETTDRDHEVEYRLLFTALAQIQMLEILNDDKVGYGDDFTFMKRRKINVLRSEHLSEAEIDTDPARFRHWSYDEVARRFTAFNEKFFKDLYFSFAPLLAIPLYQQTRPHADIWKGVVPESPSSFWEHEALANYFGDDAFRHPACATQSLLKTRIVGADARGTRVEVTAHGYRVEDRVDYVEVWGGDGELHSVPVPWDEYLPVSHARTMTLSERTEPEGAFAAAFARSPATAFRRSIRSFL